MDEKTQTYQELLAALGQRVFVIRAALDRIDGRLVIRKFIADLTPNGGASQRYWDYGHVVFIESGIQADHLNNLLERHQGSLADRAVFCPELQQQAYVRRLPSRSSWDPDPLPFPQTRCELQAPNAFGAEPQGFLIGQDGEPSYADWTTATLDFLFRLNRKPTAQSIPSAFGVLRIADSRAWIRDVKVGAASIQVTLAGEPAGARIEINDPQHKAARRVTGSRRTFRFGYETGVPDGLWIVVSRSGEWLDYRRIDRPHLEELDPSLDQQDPELLVSSLTAQGEGPHLEFKREISAGGREGSRWLRTVSAFANSGGGVIIFGVAERSSDREGEVVGLTGTVRELHDRLDRMIRDNLDPTPVYEIKPVAVSTGTVILLAIKPGDLLPYAVHPAKPAYYVRRGASTFPARVAEVRQLAAPRNANAANAFPGLHQTDL